MGPGNNVQMGSISPYKGGILREKGRPIVKYRDFLPSAVQKTAELDPHTRRGNFKGGGDGQPRKCSNMSGGRYA